MNICICGGGSLGHVCAGFLAAQQGVNVSILTQRPALWKKESTITDPENKVFTGNLATITSDAAEAVSGCDIVLLCLPGYLIEKTLRQIAPHIGTSTFVGSIVASTGFFFFAHAVLPANRLFGFQRVPLIARARESGSAASLLGYKPRISVAVENAPDAEIFRQTIEKLFRTPTDLLGSFYEAALTNSNPILHTGRLYSMWRNWDGTPYDHNILFYREWTDEASQCIIDMDAEFMRLLSQLPVRKDSIPTLLDYYESKDAASLTKKISSIPAFVGIQSPMKETPDGWIPDFSSRYFTEDFPFGLRFIVELAQKHGVATPVIDEVYRWGKSVTASTE